MKFGMALSTFTGDVSLVVEMAVAAESAGLDGVFVYDHLIGFAADAALRPSLESTALLGAIASSTSRIELGPLVTRSGVRFPAMVAASADTLCEIAPDRVIVSVGTGDAQSAAEDTMFGIERGARSERLEVLRRTIGRLRTGGIPVWVGGRSAAAVEIATEQADGLNLWGIDPATFKVQAESIRRRVAGAQPDRSFALSWAGLAHFSPATAPRMRLGHNDFVLEGGPRQIANQLLPILEADPDWIILAPLPPHGESSVEDVAAVTSLLRRG